jgi:hypothetical protein
MPLGNKMSPPMRAVIAGALLLLVTLVTYLPALRGKFICDDDAHVTAASLRSSPPSSTTP